MCALSAPRTVAIVVLVMAMGGQAAWAQSTGTMVPLRKWERVQSPHFTVVGDVGARALLRVAEQMEQFHELLALLLRQPEMRVPDTTVIVFKDRRSYRPFQPTFQGQRVDVAGYFLAGPMNYVTLLAGPDANDPSVVYHEYVHLVLGTTLGVLPTWMSEGLAEFYSTVRIAANGKTAELGNFSQQHIWRLQKEMMPLRALAEVGHDSPHYNERDKSSVFYGESWALIHYLQLGKERKYAQQTAAFLEAITSGQSIDQASRGQLGITGAVLEEELRRYVYVPAFLRLVVQLPEKIGRLDRVPATKVTEADANATLGDLLVQMRDPAAARALFNHALSTDPAHALALASLAELSAREDAADSEEWSARASRATGGTYLSHFHRGRALAQAARTAEETTTAIAAFRQSMALNPTFADARAHLAVLLAESSDGQDEARNLLQSAIALAPAREDYVLNLARVHLLQANPAAARAMLGPLVARGSSLAVRTRAREFLGLAAGMENAAAEPGALPDAGLSTLPPVVDLPSPSDPTERPTGTAAPDTILDLRPVEPTETRVAGRLVRIECGANGVILVVSTGVVEVRVAGPDLADIEFVSFRPDLSGAIKCGVQTPAFPVLITYGLSPDDSVAGEVAVVEFLPDGFRPPGGR